MKKYLITYRELNFDKPAELVRKFVNNTKEFKAQQTNPDTFKIMPYKYSFMLSEGRGFGKPVALNLEIEKAGSGTTKIILSTRRGFKLFQLAAVWLVITSFALYGSLQLPLEVTLILVPGVLLSVWLLHRSQEQALQDKVEKALKRYAYHS